MWKSTMNPRIFPNINVEVLFVGNGVVVPGYYAGYNGAHDVWKSSREGFTFWDTEVTYWMPLPKPPKEPKKRIKDHVCNNDYCELE